MLLKEKRFKYSNGRVIYFESFLPLGLPSSFIFFTERVEVEAEKERIDETKKVKNKIRKKKREKEDNRVEIRGSAKKSV